MKKLLSVIICLFLSFSMTTLLTSCTVIVSNDEFRAVEISEIKSLLPHITALEENHSIDYDSGANLSMTIDTTTENEAYQTKKSQIETLSMKTIKTNGLFQTEGSNNDTATITINEGQPSVTISNIDFYATDSVYYFIWDTGDSVVRFKHNENLMLSAEKNFTPMIQYFPIENYVEITENDSSAKWYIDDTQEFLKIKLDINKTNEKTKVVWVYDAQYKLHSIKISLFVSSKITNSKTTKRTTFSFERWQGTITPPADLDSYELFPTPF